MPAKHTREEILKKKREAAKARLIKIKNDPIKLAEYKEKERLKYLKKKEKRQRKSISEMTPRQQRSTRKMWRKYSAEHRKKQVISDKTDSLMICSTPPASDEQMHRIAAKNVENRRQMAARKRSQRQIRMRIKETKEKDKFICELKSKLNSQRQKYRRLKNKMKKGRSFLTPKTKIQNMADDPNQRNELVKKALFGEVLQTQISLNLSNANTHQDRSNIKRLIAGKIVDKYKLWRHNNMCFTYKNFGYNKTKYVGSNEKKKLRDVVQNFYEDDSNSRQAAGKKECISLRKVTKQKRYLLDSLQNLHKKFLQMGERTIGYALFCRLRPYWVIPPKVSDRETCACITHENVDLKILALNNSKIIGFNSFQKLLQILCCDRYSENCLARTCDACAANTLHYDEYDDNRDITFKQWVHRRELIQDQTTKKERYVTKYKKQVEEVKSADLIHQLEGDIPKLLRHEKNIVHQYKTIKFLKKTLTEKDAIIHMDFSENYNAKYSREIQSFHFGGSRTQICLHTVVVYTKDTTGCYCTISSNLSHNVSAIWAHLEPVLKALPSTVENLHFLSDGPVTQYRNKTMFFILACRLLEFYSNTITFSWNYHEAGHGKGAPDGIGATCKRSADQLIAQNRDITNLDEFVHALREKCPGIKIHVIEQAAIEKVDNMIRESERKLVPFKGTLLVHQVSGSIYRPNRLLMKELSCFCDPDACEHYKLGTLQYENDIDRLDVDNIFTDSETEFSRQGSDKNEVKLNFSSGDYILVKFPMEKKEYRYAAICSKFDEEEGELTVTFLNVCDDNLTVFRLDENDIADISVDHVIEKLPVPNLNVKGNRLFYKFKNSVNVFEK